MKKTDYICTLPKQMQVAIMELLKETNTSPEDIEIAMNGRLSDLDFDLKEIERHINESCILCGGRNMTRKEMDQLNVGDKVEVRKYNTTTEKYEWIPAIVNQVLVCSDGGKFAHGGYHSVLAKVNGFTETLDNELARLCK